MRSLTLVLLVGCSYGPSDGPEPLGGSRTVTGQVIDWKTSAGVDGAASVATSGVLPAPQVTIQGASFTIENVPDNSTFQIVASVSPTHRPTFGPSVEVLTTDLTGIQAPAVSEAFLSEAFAGFAITPAADKGVLLLELVDEAGVPRADLPGGQLIVGGDGPHFLDAALAPDDAATRSSTSGYAMFFDVPVGLAELAPAAQPVVTLAMPASPIAANTVTIARVIVTDGAPELPTNVQFARDIVPIFSARGCDACHSGGGIGKDLGGLKLDGPASQVYAELMETPARVNRGDPAKSLVLTRPARENPPDVHPNVTFASASDPDYVKLLVWITEGAKQN